MKQKYILLFLAVLIVSSSCGVNVSNANEFTATPGFVTSTLPPTKIPPSTHTSLPATPTAEIIEGTVGTAISASEGITTTQLNVRMEPSTASETLGMVNQFATVQVIGKDASGSWYQISYINSKGWVRAEYVQVNATVEIPVIRSVTGSGSGMSGLVIQKINVRGGPGINYEALGVLKSKGCSFYHGQGFKQRVGADRICERGGWKGLGSREISGCEEPGFGPGHWRGG